MEASMNRNELTEIFERNHVPEWYYSFYGAGRGDCLVLEFLEGSWTLSYYTERGCRIAEGTFTTEADGCEAMFDAMVGMVQGAQKRTIAKNP